MIFFKQRFITAIGTTLLITLSGCSMVFTVRHTNIYTDSETELYVKNEKIEDYRNDSYRISIPKQKWKNINLQLKKEGYKTINEVLYPDKFNHAIWLSILTPAIELLGYHRNYPRKLFFELTKEPSFAASLNDLTVVRVNVDSLTFLADYEHRRPARWRKFVTKYGYHSRTPGLENDEINEFFDEEYSESTTLSELRKDLGNYGAYDTTSYHYTRYNDYSLYIDIESIERHRVRLYRNPSMYSLAIQADFSILDAFGDTLLQRNIESLSGNYFTEIRLEYVFYDALESAMITFINDEEFPELKLDDEHPHKLAADAIEPTVKADITSVFTDPIYIKRSDFQLLGIPLSSDGLVAFPRSALEFSEEIIEVFDTHDHTYTPEILFEDLNNDFMVLRIDKTFESCFEITSKQPEITDVCKVLGFNDYYEVPLASKGYISGIREERGMTVLQTDAESNHLNYPAVFNEDNQLIGFVSQNFDTTDINSMAFFHVVTKDMVVSPPNQHAH